MLANLPAVLRIIAQDLPTDHLTPGRHFTVTYFYCIVTHVMGLLREVAPCPPSTELKSQLVQLLHLLNGHHLAQVEAALPHLPPDQLAILKTALQPQ